MPDEPQEIEVEVLETTDLPRPVDRETESPAEARGDFPFPDIRRWKSSVRTLDMRWWPLWLFLAIIATALLATFGVAAFVCYLIFRVLRGIVSLIFGKS